MALLGKSYTSPASPRISKIAKSATPGSKNLSLEQQNGPNPSERCIGRLMCAPEIPTEDKCDGRWAYLSSYLYRQPLPESQNLENLPRTTSGNQNLLLERQVSVQTSVQALNTLFAHGRRRIWSIAVVRHTCRVIYITSPAQNLKNHENLPRTTSETHNRRP